MSVLINCCKGDAARAIKMIPRPGVSYEKAIEQLKMQYKDPKRVNMAMIKQLKAMKHCKDDPRTLRYNLNGIQAIIATLQKQRETVDTTHMLSMVLETFSKRIQEEVIRKEVDPGKHGNMKDLLENNSIAVKRREHVETREETPKRSVSLTCQGFSDQKMYRLRKKPI
ncbi:hypothetical protein ANCCAN_08629 [Ancylostoma caninum]|uniref:Uncharacterized protein n=1 Tax=Ancylostoma caninum TaxID=29170 RepID=A0A368GNW0_ANCCA|nr:hypothetical protein ANCCAN_08629 [Ancylostoma caninum]